MHNNQFLIIKGKTTTFTRLALLQICTSIITNLNQHYYKSVPALPKEEEEKVYG